MHKLLITGDLLFVGKVGGTQSDDDARIEWRSLERLLAIVPDEATVWPGHDAVPGRARRSDWRSGPTRFSSAPPNRCS